MKRKRVDLHAQRKSHLVERINQINAWRNEAVKHAVTQEQKDKIDARALELRQAVERTN